MPSCPCFKFLAGGIELDLCVENSLTAIAKAACLPKGSNYMKREAPKANEKQLTPEQRHALILAGVGPFQQKFKWPYFTRLNGTMLRKLVEAGAVLLAADPEAYGYDYDSMPPRDFDQEVFKSGYDQQALAFLEKYPKFMAQGFVGNCGVGRVCIETIISETKLTRKEAAAFEEVFGSADEFWVSNTPSRSKGAEGLFARAWFD
jgi:hypothetical protein